MGNDIKAARRAFDEQTGIDDIDALEAEDENESEDNADDNIDDAETESSDDNKPEE